MYHKEGLCTVKGKWSRRVVYDEWNREVCKMNLLGPLNTQPQEVWLVIMEGECSQVTEAFLREGNVGYLAEPPMDGLRVPSEATRLILSLLLWLQDEWFGWNGDVEM